jgi:prepilin-type N-terminal cleavage/methylation domain-containing protein
LCFTEYMLPRFRDIKGFTLIREFFQGKKSRINPQPLRGFTLIELLVVIAIIGILSTLGIANYLPTLAKGRDAQRIDDARKMIAALEQYKSDNGAYPIAPGWINSGTGTTWIAGLVPDYMDKVPADPRNVYAGGVELVYWYRSDGVDYCIQISQERPALTHRFYKGYWNNSWKLRFGAAGGPNAGQCLL